ncbi:MAG: carotenoid biosynthesis protein [Bacteroidota bacterium]
MKPAKTVISILFLCILYAVILVSTTLFETDLLHLSSMGLLISAFVLFANHPRIDPRFVAYAMIVFVFGWILSYAGVETGVVFGQYFYGNNLGYKVLDIPIVIGLSWLLLNYCSSIIAHRLCSQSVMLNRWFPKAFLAATLMVLLDVFMEQAAPMYDYWYWKNQTVPMQNYTAWFAFAFAFNYLFQRLEINAQNKVAIAWYIIMIVFYAGLSMLPELLFNFG